MDEDVSVQSTGAPKSYKIHWTVLDYLNAVLRAGFTLDLVEEFGEQVRDWDGAPMQEHPGNLLIVARKISLVRLDSAKEEAAPSE